MNENEVVERVMSMLERRTFAEFYNENGLFDKYITGDLASEKSIDNDAARKLVVERLKQFLFPDNQ